MNNTSSFNSVTKSVPLFRSLGDGTAEHQPETIIQQGFDAFHPLEQKREQMEHLKQRNDEWNASGTTSLKALANKVLTRNIKWNACGTSGNPPMSASNSRNNDQKNDIKNQKKYPYTPADIADIDSIPQNESEPIDFPILLDANNKTLTHQDISIIRSYPLSLHELLTTLLNVRDGKYAEISLTQQDLENFRHNMRWFFVSIEYYIKGWHPADVRTLWSDGWREQDIVCFMASQKVKYILFHNDKIIQCLDLNNGVYVFEKKKRTLSERKPVEETS